MAKIRFQCHGCSRFDTPECSSDAKQVCASFLSWSELWARETAAIERAQRITYAAAALLVVLATTALIFPKALLS